MTMMMARDFEGLELKRGWCVGKLLGSGACAQVYECTGPSSSPSSSYVAKVAVVPTRATNMSSAAREEKAMADTLYAENILYATVLQRAPQCFAAKVGYGEVEGIRYLLLERLGTSLGDELRRLRRTEQSMSGARLAHIGGGVLDALECLHAAGYAYVDMKPDNVMLGTWCGGAAVGDEARLVDFGVSTRFISAMTGGHREASGGAPCAGTPRFLGLAAHRDGTPPCRRDDVEALAHVLLCAMCGDLLPWDGATTDDAALLRAKLACADPAEVLRQSALPTGSPIAEALCDFLKTARATPFADKPDYAALRRALAALARASPAVPPPSTEPRQGRTADDEARKEPFVAAPVDYDRPATTKTTTSERAPVVKKPRLVVEIIDDEEEDMDEAPTMSPPLRRSKRIEEATTKARGRQSRS